MQPCLHIIQDQNNTIGFTHSIKVGKGGGKWCGSKVLNSAPELLDPLVKKSEAVLYLTTLCLLICVLISPLCAHILS